MKNAAYLNLKTLFVFKVSELLFDQRITIQIFPNMS